MSNTQGVSQKVAVADPNNPTNVIKPNADGSINVVGGGAGGNTTMTATAAAPSYVEGSTNNPISSDLHGSQRAVILDASGVNVDWASPVPVTQSGTWDLRNITGTVSLPTGAATETSLAKLTLSQGSTTTGQSGALVQGAVTTAAPTYTNGQTSPFSINTGGALRVEATGSGTTASPAAGLLTIQGLQADDAALGATVTNPVPVGGKYNLTLPNYADGDRAQAQFGARGALNVQIRGADNTQFLPLTGAAFGNSAGLTGAIVYDLLWRTGGGGNVMDNKISIEDSTDAPTGRGVQAVASAPTNQAGQAVAPSATSVAASSLVLKSGAGNLFGLNVVSGASAGVVYVFDATSLPANGTVTPKKAYIVAANSERTVIFDPPIRCSTGITIGFGTGTNPFSLAASATAFISGEAL